MLHSLYFFAITGLQLKQGKLLLLPALPPAAGVTAQDANLSATNAPDEPKIELAVLTTANALPGSGDPPPLIPSDRPGYSHKIGLGVLVCGWQQTICPWGRNLQRHDSARGPPGPHLLCRLPPFINNRLPLMKPRP